MLANESYTANLEWITATFGSDGSKLLSMGVRAIFINDWTVLRLGVRDADD